MKVCGIFTLQRPVYATMAAHQIQRQIVEMHLDGKSEDEIAVYFGGQAHPDPTGTGGIVRHVLARYNEGVESVQ